MNNKQILTIIGVIGLVSLISGVAYGVSNGTIVVGDLTVTGTCTGCGVGSGSFTTWATTLNSTIAGTTGDPVIYLQTSTDGSVLVSNTSDKVALVKLDGTVVTVKSAPSNTVNTGEISSAQSIDGTYKILLVPTAINVYKNNLLLTTIGISPADFFAGDLGTVSVSISADGKYISVAGKDTGGALNRVVILTGS